MLQLTASTGEWTWAEEAKSELKKPGVRNWSPLLNLNGLFLFQKACSPVRRYSAGGRCIQDVPKRTTIRRAISPVWLRQVGVDPFVTANIGGPYLFKFRHARPVPPVADTRPRK